MKELKLKKENLTKGDVELDVTIDLENMLFVVKGDGTTFEVEGAGVLSLPRLAIFVSFSSIDRESKTIKIL